MRDACRIAAPSSLLNISAATLDFWLALTQPNSTAGRKHWPDSPAPPLVRTRRYFCCGTAQRAWFTCDCLKLPRNPKESWPVCLDHQLQPTAPLAAPREPAAERCLVYSFGIAQQWEFDDGMADAGCEVHSFDPTGSSMEAHARHTHNTGRVHFHPWGLSSEAAGGCGARSRAAGGPQLSRLEARRFVGGTYGNLTGPLYSLDRIVRKLGHTGRRIAVLKVDCEGCEWDAFHHLASRAPQTLAMVDAIYLELHLALQMSAAEDLVKWATMHHLLFETEGFRLWWLHANGAKAPGARMHPALQALPRARSVPMAWEIGLRRVAPAGRLATAKCPAGARRPPRPGR